MLLLARCFYYLLPYPKIIISRLFIIKARGIERCYYEFSIRFESFIDSLKLIFLHYSLYNSAFKFLFLRNTHAILRYRTSSYTLRRRNASKQNYNIVKEALHVKWKIMLSLTYACILAILLSVANDFINFCFQRRPFEPERK